MIRFIIDEQDIDAGWPTQRQKLGKRLLEGYWFENDAMDKTFALCEDERFRYAEEFGVDPLLGAPKTALFLNEVYGIVNSWHHLNDPDRIEFRIVDDETFKEESLDIIEGICDFLDFDPSETPDPHLPPMRCRPFTSDAFTAAHRAEFRILLADAYSDQDPDDDLCQFLLDVAEIVIAALIIGGGALLIEASAPVTIAAVGGAKIAHAVAEKINEEIAEALEEAAAAAVEYAVDETARDVCGNYSKVDEAISELKQTDEFRAAVSSRICSFVDDGALHLQHAILNGELACDSEMRRFVDAISQMASQHGCSPVSQSLTQTYLNKCINP